MTFKEIEGPKIPPNGWFTEKCLDIIAGDDKELKDILRPRRYGLPY